MFIDQETKKEVNINYAYKGFSKLETPEQRAKAGVIKIPDPVPPENIRSDVEVNPDHYTVSSTGDQMPPYKVWIRNSDEQIAEIMRGKAKIERKETVARIIVTTKSGKKFDGDEESQGRMARAIVALDPLETQLWVLADNTPDPAVSREELREALRLAGAAQTTVWTKPYA